VTSVTINPGDSTDIAALINAALADPAVTTVILGEGVFLLHSPIFIPSGKTLDGAGRDLTILRAADGFDRVAPGEGDGVVNSEIGAVGITLTDFSIDADKLTPDGTRMVGCFMKNATDFTIARVDVYNATAYGHFARGDTVNYAPYASGTYDDCGVYNCQIAFEQMACDGITLTDCVAGDGDGDLVGTYFHPLTGSKNITYINCRATGFANVGFELTGNVRPLENIRIIDCQVEMLSGGAALVAAGAFQTFGLHLERSSFISHGNIAALLYGVIGTAQDSYFQGDTIGIAFYHSSNGFASDFWVSDSHVLGMRHPFIGAAYGISSSGGTIVWEGGSIEARGPAVISTSGPVTVSPETIVTLEGYDSRVDYVENGDAILIGPAVVLDGLPPGTLNGGSLTVAFEVNGNGADQLGILNQGTGAGQIGLSGADVTFGGAVIGTWSGGANGEDLVVSLGAGATAAAVAALAQAITFVTLTDNPRDYRAIELVVADALGASVETNVAIAVAALNDAPAISSGAIGAEPTLVYTESGGPAAIAPDLTLTDVDSRNFAGGSLTIQFNGNGDAGDRLSILSQGNGLGQVGVSGNVVSFGGIAIGTFSGGHDGASPLVISLNVNARPASVEALARNVAYSNVSLVPSAATRTVSFTVDDGDGAPSLDSATATILFEELDDPAMAKADDAATDADLGIVAASVFADNGHGVDIDPDGPALQVGAVNGAAADVGEELILASGAKLVLRADGTFDYDPNGMFDHLADAGTGAVNSVATDSFTYTLAGGGTATVTITIEGVASPGDRLEGDAGNNTITGTAGADSFFVEQGGNDKIDGGEGDDSIYYGGALSAADRTAGGAGTDTIILFGSYTLGLGAGSLTGIERLVLESGSAQPAGVPNLYAITTANAIVASGAALQILAGQLQADEGLVFNGSAETDGRFVVESGLGDDIITLGGGADLVHSGGGNDRIDGRSGADILHGGTGNDLYFVDHAGDVVAENGGEGDDEVRTGLAAYSLTPDVERLTGTSTAGQALTGNDLANIIGGLSGSDVIDGGVGADTMSGGQGNDVFIVDNAGDIVAELANQGLDEVRTNLASYSLAGVANVENLTGGAGDQSLTGNGFNNRIDGGAGADAMAGGAGHDTYIVDNLGDTIAEIHGAGIDEVRTSLGSKALPDRAVYVLPSFVENLTGTSAGAQGVRGNSLNNVINMGVGHDLIVLDDGGVDTVNGGAGNDFIYYGDKLTAADVTNGGAGVDTVGLMGNYAAGLVFTATNLVGVERLAFYTGGGTNSYNVTMHDANVAAGTEFFVTAASLNAGETLIFNGAAETNGRFTVHGGGGADTITGGAGSDFVIGNAGNDSLLGLGGMDFLIGGLGADQLRGGAGSDRFVYQSTAQSTAGGVDRILDFEQIDLIDLSAIDANGNAGDGDTAFSFVGSAAFSNTAGELRAYQSGADWFVEGDVDGDGIADLSIQVAMTDPLPLVGDDFIL
jgi:Ca2+-binding RTX toxin-like protein